MNMHIMQVHRNPSHRSMSWKWIKCNHIIFMHVVTTQVHKGGGLFLTQQTTYNKIRIIVWE